MRLTTKIIIGIILSIFSIALLFIVCFSFTGRKNRNHSNVKIIHLPQENQTGIELPPFRTVIIDEEPYESEEPHITSGDNGSLYIHSIPEKNSPAMLFIPESLKDCVSTGMTGDTLNIKLKLLDLHNKHKSDEYKHHAVFGINLHFIPSEIDIINKLRNLSIQIKNIETDTVKVNSYGDVSIDSCNADVITPVIRTGYKKLTVKNCRAKKINLDLDSNSHWNIENCNIEEENLTGSRNHDMIRHRNESGKINWLPKNREAKLNITVQGDTTQISFNNP
ncbi:MAG: hypothetical protein LBL07_05375 [Tannerella sp.]|jgi:cbb3-type cytochrome oxidase subunit 3|nr:hypothetical protein [Tannerella sp.]